MVDPVRLARLLQRLGEQLDIAHHLLASELWGPADDSADAVKVLGRHGVISTELAERLARAVGFRNVRAWASDQR